MKNGANGNNTSITNKNLGKGFDNQNDESFKNYQEWLNNNKNLLHLNKNLAKVNVKSATMVAELEDKYEELNLLNSKLANANALSADLMAEVEEKNEKLVQTNNGLAKANAHAADLMAVIELKDEEIKKLNKSLAEVNARSANLVARRELQVVNIRELNTELQYEVEVRQNTEENLKKLNETKDRFFSIIAHDLRNPFISFVNLVTILKEHSESFTKDEIIELIGDLHSSALNTQTLLENLLEWTKTQTDRLEVEPKAYRLKSIFDEIMLVCKHHADSKNITIESKINDEITILADKNMICTVMRNLLSNSIKFSEKESKINVLATDINNKIIISVKDNGIGISQKNMEKLFRLDSKITSHGTDNEKGSGLGLILCKEFIEKNGGKISVESKPGEGSIFTFSVPSVAKRN
ncbi:MAG: hypothetical protein HQ541_14010 [Mariniphaga sp.]|nr:hypothetical protein [Mariniphaga sp.]